MTDHDLSDLLERAAGEVTTGPAPTAAMLRDASRVRRRRTLTLSLAAAAATAVVAGGTTALTTGGDDPVPPPATTSPTPTAPPAATRLVGVGQLAIAVPQRWGTNDTRCGTPRADTVVVDVGAVELCLTPRPKGVESLEITEGEPRFDFTVDEVLTVDGVNAQRQRTTCEVGYADVRVCSGTVHFPTEGVSFRAESSTGAAEVDRILERIALVPDQVGVPGYQRIALNQQQGGGERYLEMLGAAGLVGVVETEKVSGLEAGHVLDVSPQPGQMVAPGSVVTVTLSAAPDGPADEVRIGINSADAAFEDYRALEDTQIRAGATLRLAVGDRVWAYASGRRASTLAGELGGDSLVVDDWKGPNYPHSWIAVSPGRTAIRLTVTADETPYDLGTVTVIVE